MSEICLRCGKRIPLDLCCYNCAFYYEEKEVGYAECLCKKIEELPENIAMRYMEELEPCPFFEETEFAGICDDCMDKNSRIIEPRFFEPGLNQGGKR